MNAEKEFFELGVRVHREEWDRIKEDIFDKGVGRAVVTVRGVVFAIAVDGELTKKPEQLISDEQFQRELEELRQYGLRQIEKAARRVERICKNCKHLDTLGVCRNLKSFCYDTTMTDNDAFARQIGVDVKELDSFGCNKFEEREK